MYASSVILYKDPFPGSIDHRSVWLPACAETRCLPLGPRDAGNRPPDTGILVGSHSAIYRCQPDFAIFVPLNRDYFLPVRRGIHVLVVFHVFSDRGGLAIVQGELHQLFMV